jgi:hypothetical protein
MPAKTARFEMVHSSGIKLRQLHTCTIAHENMLFYKHQEL